MLPSFNSCLEICQLQFQEFFLLYLEFSGGYDAKKKHESSNYKESTVILFFFFFFRFASYLLDFKMKTRKQYYSSEWSEWMKKYFVSTVYSSSA